MRVLGLSGWAATCISAVGALVGVLFVWRPWLESGMQCGTLKDGARACMPVMVVPPPPWAYFALAFGGAVVALLLVAAAADVHRRVYSP